MLFDYFNDIYFADPWAFGLLFLVPLLIAWYIIRRKKQVGAFLFSTSARIQTGTWKTAFRHLLMVFRLISLILIIFALARPQTKSEEKNVEGEGLDIILCIDVSGSMTAQDFTPNRLEAAKRVATDFVNKRLTDRIGIVIFAGESFTQCPLTTDHAVLLSAIGGIRNGILEDGTAIGNGLGTGVDRLRTSKSKSKIIILLTDGENNGGLIDPRTAKEIAKTFGIKVYTIGVGTEGYARQPVQTPLGIVYQNMKVSIDEKLLNEIATETGAKYFRAKDNTSLANIYNDINNLEKSKVQISSIARYTEKFYPFIMAALFLLLIEVLMRFTFLKKFP